MPLAIYGLGDGHTHTHIHMKEISGHQAYTGVDLVQQIEETKTIGTTW